MVISTDTNAPPNSHIEADLSDGSHFSARWSDGDVLVNGQAQPLIPHNVVSLMFTSNSLDPRLVQISLLMQARSAPDQVESVLIPNKSVNMVAP